MLVDPPANEDNKAEARQNFLTSEVRSLQEEL